MKSEEGKKYLNIIADKASTKNFCISNSKFSAITNINCTVSGYYDAQFRQLPTDIVGLTVTLTNNDF
jgi:predicted nucleic-acid-binding Zn-ribbon protein